MPRYAVTVTLTFNASNAGEAERAAYATLADAFEGFAPPTHQPEDFPELTNWTYNPEPLALDVESGVEA